MRNARLALGSASAICLKAANSLRCDYAVYSGKCYTQRYIHYIPGKQETAVSIPTQEDAHLMVELFKLRLDPYLQQSETWFATKFEAKSWEEVKAKYPLGSREWRVLETVRGYW